MDTFFHFPPDLFNLLVDTIPRLNKSKRDLLIFFQSVGVPEGYLRPFYDLLNSNNSQFKKFNVTRELLRILNQQTDKMLGVRRQLLKRVIEFDSFDACFPNDKDRAKANVAEIQKIVKLKDTVTRYENYLSNEQSQKLKAQAEKADLIRKSKSQFINLRQEFSQLFSIQSPQERGRKLETVLNNLFSYFNIGIKESFSIYDGESGKIYEQIDGVIEVNHYLTLLEMKWEKVPIGTDKVGRFISLIWTRPQKLCGAADKKLHLCGAKCRTAISVIIADCRSALLNVTKSPLSHLIKNGEQIMSHFCQRVFHVWWNLVVLYSGY